MGDGFPPFQKGRTSALLHGNLWTWVTCIKAGTWETLNPDPDPQQLVILRGIEVARAKRRPIKDVYTWIQCFAIYITAPFSKIVAFATFAQPANALTLLIVYYRY